MNLRFFIEMGLFFTLVIVFQYYISASNKDLHLMLEDLTQLVQLGEVI